jgi:hypothetical protein
LNTIDSDTPYIDYYFVGLEGYIRHKGDIKSKVEKDNVIYHEDDSLLAVNGENIGSRSLEDVTSWIKAFTDETTTMTFLNRNVLNRHHKESVCKG